MRKIIVGFLITILMILPFSIDAYEYGIENFYIEATVEESGDLRVKEYFILNGSYNGFERIINYSNLNAKQITNTLDDLTGSELYNGYEIEIINVGASNYDKNIGYQNIYNDYEKFDLVDYASKGDYGVYSTRIKSNGVALLIYNPKNKAFVVEYKIKGLGILHNDIGEIGWNIFSNEMTESIKNLEAIINVPNSDFLRVWAHGPLWGETKIINDNKFSLTIYDLDAREAIDTRFIFNKNVINKSNKYSNLNAFDEIVRIETDLANSANKEREEYLRELEEQAEYYTGIAETKKSSESYDDAVYYVSLLPNTSLIKQDLLERLDIVKEAVENKKIIGSILPVIWIIGLIILVVYNYIKYDKEYKAAFKGDYYRDIPQDYGPSNVSYLINRQIGSNELSSTILNLIADKVIKTEEIQTKKDKDYKLILDNTKDLKEADKKIVEWIFYKNEILLSDIKYLAKTGYDKFLKNYNEWKTLAFKEAKGHNFYETTNKVKGYSFLYLLIGIVIPMFPITGEIYSIVTLSVIIISIIAFIYLISYTRRTKEGNEDYHKWMALKKFLNDFGNFKTRDLPDMILWEKFLVYASVFGIAKKLSKTMELKIKELNEIGYTHPNMFDYMMFNRIMRINNTINKEIRNSVTSANAERARVESANSSRSSGGGFGGGFSGGSGGGGSFGGGGGGGSLLNKINYVKKYI